MKSWYFNYLIPPGKADDASIQQWWDAHVYVYNTLVANTTILQRLCDPFAQIAQNESERVVYRTTIRAEHFTPTQNWTML